MCRIRGPDAIKRSRAMKLFHPTRHAGEILRDGFGETSGTYLTPTDYSGVWLFDRPLDERIGDDDPDVILELEIPEEVVAPFEWFVGLSYREFLMPARIVNQYGPPIKWERAIGADM
jgi:hypothetical protein